MAIAILLKKTQVHSVDVIDFVDPRLEHHPHGLWFQDAISPVTAFLQVGNHKFRHIIGGCAHAACRHSDDELERLWRLRSSQVALRQIFPERCWYWLLE